MKLRLTTLLVMAAVAAPLAIPATSSAFWLQNLHAEGTTYGARFDVEVCNAKGRYIHADFDWSNQEEEGYIYHSPWFGRSHYYCADLIRYEPTSLWEGLWGTGVSVTVGRTTKTLEPVTFEV
jgi:hypothetical protein